MRPARNAENSASVIEAELLRLREENARLMERVAALEILADRDPLTTALNRRAFMRELNRVLGFCKRYRSTASVVFFDMDGFKAINDIYGHAAGDVALQTVVATLAANVRESDVVGRLGGDEFAIILAQADKSSATAKAESLKYLIERGPAPTRPCISTRIRTDEMQRYRQAMMSGVN